MGYGVQDSFSPFAKTTNTNNLIRKDNILFSYNNKTKDWALVQNAASAGVKVKLGLFK